MPLVPADRRTRTLVVPLSLGNNTFRFELHTRPLSLGPDVVVQYYWINSSELRALQSDRGRNNVRSITEYWAGAMREMGWFDDAGQQLHYVLARAYELVVRQKGTQSVYRDAFLGSQHVGRGEDALPDDLQKRVQAVVGSRDRTQLGRELDNVLGWSEPPAAVKPQVAEAFRRWAVNGVVALRKNGPEGVAAFMVQLEYWLRKFRKRCAPWIRQFLNLFAYEAKAALYTCYANAWVGLIPWLRQHRGLDEISARFLSFWHHQSHPVAIPQGQTLAGPCVADVQPVIAGNCNDVSTVTCHHPEPTEPTRVRDVFNGQVLALHPLSGIFMQHAGLRAIAGQFFAGPEYDLVFRRGAWDQSRDYWNLLGGILSAAFLYRRALDRQVKRTAGGSGNVLPRRDTVPAEDRSTAGYLEDYLAARGSRCACGEALRPDLSTITGRDGIAIISCVCVRCGTATRTEVHQTLLTDWLSRE